MKLNRCRLFAKICLGISAQHNFADDSVNIVLLNIIWSILLNLLFKEFSGSITLGVRTGHVFARTYAFRFLSILMPFNQHVASLNQITENCSFLYTTTTKNILDANYSYIFHSFLLNIFHAISETNFSYLTRKENESP